MGLKRTHYFLEKLLNSIKLILFFEFLHSSRFNPRPICVNLRNQREKISTQIYADFASSVRFRSGRRFFFLRSLQKRKNVSL